MLRATANLSRGREVYQALATRTAGNGDPPEPSVAALWQPGPCRSTRDVQREHAALPRRMCGFESRWVLWPRCEVAATRTGPRSGCGPAWSGRLPWKQESVGPDPSIPTGRCLSQPSSTSVHGCAGRAAKRKGEPTGDGTRLLAGRGCESLRVRLPLLPLSRRPCPWPSGPGVCLPSRKGEFDSRRALWTTGPVGNRKTTLFQKEVCCGFDSRLGHWIDEWACRPRGRQSACTRQRRVRLPPRSTGSSCPGGERDIMAPSEGAGPGSTPGRGAGSERGQG